MPDLTVLYGANEVEFTGETRTEWIRADEVVLTEDMA